MAENLEAAGFTEHHVEALEFVIDYGSVDDWWASQSDLSMRFAAGRATKRGRRTSPPCERPLEQQAERFATAEGALRIPARTWVAWGAA